MYNYELEKSDHNIMIIDELKAIISQYDEKTKDKILIQLYKKLPKEKKLEVEDLIRDPNEPK